MQFDLSKFKIYIKVQMYKYGKSSHEIAKGLGLCRSDLYRWLNEMYSNLSRLDSHLINTINEFSIDYKTHKIIETIGSVDNKDWKYIVSALLFSLDINQTQLSSMLGFNKCLSHISCWIRGVHSPSNSLKFKLIEIIQSHRQNINKLSILGRQIQNSLLIDNNLIKLNKLIGPKSKNKKLISKINRRKFINTDVLLPSTINGKNILLNSIKDSFILFYKNKSREQPYPLIIPKLIEINRDLIVGLGIYLGEGTRTERKVKVSNSEPIIIEQAMRFFKILGIDKGKLSPWLQIHEYSNIASENVKMYWENMIGLKINKIWIKPKTGEKVVPVKQYGVIHLECNFTMARILIDALLAKVKEIIYATEEGPEYLLQGLFAAEGSVAVRKSGGLQDVEFTSLRAPDRDLVKELLQLHHIEIGNSLHRGTIKIHGYYNLKRLYELDIFKYNPERKYKLEHGFHNLKKIPNINKNRILELLKNNDYYKTSEIQKLTNLSYKNTYNHLKGLYDAGKINKISSPGPVQTRWFSSLSV